MNPLWDSPITIGGQGIKNRIVFPPISTNWAEEDGSPNGRVEDFYGTIAAGGCGMIVAEGTAVSSGGKSCSRSLCLDRPEKADGFRRISEAIKRNGCFSVIQILHVGGQGNPEFNGSPPAAPSDYSCSATGCVARALTIEEISSVRGDFIRAALLAEAAGFQAVELHLAHGYLLHEFLSGYFNKRTDEYGGSLERRMRLVRDIIIGIRAGSKILLGARISGEDYVPGGIDFESNKQIIPILDRMGIEYFSVTAGIYDTSKAKHAAMRKGAFFGYARRIKGLTAKPIVGVGKVLDLDSADAHLAAGDCDLVGIGRAMIAEPHLVDKVRRGEDFRRCTECDECQYLRFGRPRLTCKVGGC